MKNRLLSFCLLLVIFTCITFVDVRSQETAPGGAPNPTVLPNSRRLIEIQAEGSTRFTLPELAAATGLQMGEEANDAALKQAADRLAASGMFQDVSYSWLSSPKGLIAKFQLSDTKQLFPATFDNFVWMSHQELLKRLAQRVPLFHGEVPNAGEMTKQISKAMETELSALGKSGTVSALPQANYVTGDLTGFIFKVSGPTPVVRELSFPGASAELLQPLQQTAARFLNAPYSESQVDAALQNDLLSQYLTRGYLRAAFQPLVVEIVNPSTDEVRVKLAVNEGQKYHFSGIRWSGNAAYSSQELGKIIKLKIGQPVNGPELRKEVDGVLQLYTSNGYLETKVDLTPQFDDGTSAVSYDALVKEGNQYRFGSVQFLGLAPNLASRCEKMWKLHPGEIFDGTYPAAFLKELSRTFDLSNVSLTSQRKLDPAAHTVAFTLQFKAN